MGLHQHVQRRNAIAHAVGIAVLLRQIAGHGHIKLRRQQEGAVFLHGEVHGTRCGFALPDHGDGVGLFAAGNGNYRAVLHRNAHAPAVFGFSHRDRHLILLVFCSGRDVHGVYTGGYRQRVGQDIFVEDRRQAAAAGGQGAQVTLLGLEAAAQVRTVAGAGVHDPNLVPGAQCAIGNGETVKAHIHEPVVQGPHPAGFPAAVIGGKMVDGADVAAVQPHGVIAFQRLTDAAHHGGILCQRDVGIHQCAVPGRAILC